MGCMYTPTSLCCKWTTCSNWGVCTPQFHASFALRCMYTPTYIFICSKWECTYTCLRCMYTPIYIFICSIWTICSIWGVRTLQFVYLYAENEPFAPFEVYVHLNAGHLMCSNCTIWGVRTLQHFTYLCCKGTIYLRCRYTPDSGVHAQTHRMCKITFDIFWFWICFDLKL